MIKNVVKSESTELHLLKSSKAKLPLHIDSRNSYKMNHFGEKQNLMYLRPHSYDFLEGGELMHISFQLTGSTSFSPIRRIAEMAAWETFISTIPTLCTNYQATNKKLFCTFLFVLRTMRKTKQQVVIEQIGIGHGYLEN